MLLEMRKENCISNELYCRLRSSAGRTPPLYGLPKIHKPDVPLRPIVAFVHSPSYQLSKYLAQILSPLVGNSDSHVVNSKEFASFIQTQKLTRDEILVSFDVVSLFTCVPVDLAVEVAQRRLSEDEALSSRTSLNVQEVVKLLRFCLSATYLSFRGEYYQQTFGTAMGSPVSVTVANLVMEDVEDRALATTNVDVKFWKRYVDDTCVALAANKCEAFLGHLNLVEPTIQFTLERELDGKLPFLDVLLEHHPDGTISTSVFRKSTHTDRYLDYSSHHPLAQRSAVVRTLQHRAEVLSSTQEALDKEKSHVADALLKNGYPRWLIRQYSNPPEKVAGRVDEQPRATISLPYIHGVSDALKRILEPFRIRTVMKPYRTLKQRLVHPKDVVPKMERSNVVYCIPCADCPASYVGETKRRLGKRMDEHRRAVQKAEFEVSALAEHAWKSDHRVDWEQITVLDYSTDWHKRLTLEACHIRRQPMPLNRDRGMLPAAYDRLMRVT